MSDQDGYPTGDELAKARDWPGPQYAALMAFVKGIWWCPDVCWREEDVLDRHGQPCRRYKISTGGWSGNEDIVQALVENGVFWIVAWMEHRRGGHYVFELRENFL
jgi:hypothetical protein